MGIFVMNLDRAAFLALATSLAAVGCAASADEADTGSDTSNIEGGRDYCWDPVTESTNADYAQWAAGHLGFDPVNNFPAAESFCFDIAADASEQYGFSNSVYQKCNSYAKLYVPFTVYSAYSAIKRKIQPSMSVPAKFGAFYEVDLSITGDTVVCKTPAATALCEPHEWIHTDGEGSLRDPSCANLASQMKPEQQAKLASCLDDQGYDAYTCAESVLR